MTDDAPPTRPSPHGPAVRVVVAAGWTVVVVALVGALRDPRLGSDVAWLSWLAGAAVLHDTLALPLTVAAGYLLRRVGPTWRSPLRFTLATGAMLALAVWPTVGRYGARSDNDTLLPLDAGRNLVLVLAALAAGAVTAGGFRRGRARRHEPKLREQT